MKGYDKITTCYFVNFKNNNRVTEKNLKKPQHKKIKQTQKTTPFPK